MKDLKRMKEIFQVQIINHNAKEKFQIKILKRAFLFMLKKLIKRDFKNQKKKHLI